MATLISVHNSEGCVGRCDAKCYNAEGGSCNCICGGKNHGAGQAVATENTRQLAEDWIENYKRSNPGLKFDFEISNNVVQKNLFE